MEKNISQNTHSFVMENRSRVVMSGVKEVEDFTDTQIILFTELGELTIKGTGLHIDKTDTVSGELIMTGQVVSFAYSSDKEKRPRNFITKLFK